jgi:hypothetical protein
MRKKKMETKENDPRFKFTGTMTVEIPITWMNALPRSLHEAEELFKAEMASTLSVVRGRIAHVLFPPGNISVKGQLVDIHHKTSITVKRDSYAAAKTPIACRDAGLCGSGDERGPDRRATGDGTRAD